MWLRQAQSVPILSLQALTKHIATENMICRACLRAGVRPQASLFSGHLLRQSPIQIRSLASITTRSFSKALPIAQIQSPQSQIRVRNISSTQRTLSSPATASSPVEPTSAGAPVKPDFLSEGESQVWDILSAEFAPTELIVQDISGGCGSMYGIEIGSEKFRGLNMLKQQRLVNAALGDLLKEWHGVQLKTRIP